MSFGRERAIRLGGAKFFVQTASHADRGSRHTTLDEALAGIEELIREGLAEPGQFNVRETDSDGNTVRVHELERGAGGASSPAVR